MGNLTSPFRGHSLLSEVDTLFEKFLEPRTAARSSEVYIPRVDIQETDQAYLLSLDVPGFEKDQIKIDSSQGHLTVSGERIREAKEEAGHFQHLERAFGRFERHFQLPNSVDELKIDAHLENGVLQVLVPKKEVAKARSITINSDKGGFFSKIIRSSEEDNH